MRVFAFEFFSGGGLAGRPLPESLAREGDLMLAALVRDLVELPGIRVLASRDPRLPPLPGCGLLDPRPGEDPWMLYARGLAQCDAAWPTAPESAGVLERLARETVAAGRTLLGCPPEAVRVAGSKHATARTLHRHGVPVVATVASGESPPSIEGRWVVKPDDGAGCADTEVVDGCEAAIERLTADSALVAQPWVEGEPMSLSLLCADGRGRLLSCNRQQITVRHGRVSLEAVIVNAVADRDGRFSRLGAQIAAALPQLRGYVGVDIVAADAGPVVLEVNPRLTTSCSGLRAALGLNVAALVLGLPDSLAGLTAPGATGRPVEIRPEVPLAT